MLSAPDEVIAWWLPMGFSRVGFEESVENFIFRDKERVRAMQVAPDKLHAFHGTNLLQRLQPRTEPIGAVPYRLWVVGHFQGNGRRQRGIVFDTCDPTSAV